MKKLWMFNLVVWISHVNALKNIWSTMPITKNDGVVDQPYISYLKLNGT